MGPATLTRTTDWSILASTSRTIDAEIARLVGLGAELKEGPIDVPGGPIIAFLKCPPETRVELIQTR